MTKTTIKRPNRITMEGMIWNANHVLEAALHPSHRGGKVPMSELVTKCHGIVLLSVVQAGLIFTGHYGSGVLLAKRKDSAGKDTWSAPAAVAAMGYGGGALIGGEVDDILIFLMNREVLMDFAIHPQTRLNLTAEATVGTHGHEVNLGLEADHHNTVSVVFSKGLFGGFGAEMGTLQVIKKADAKFYNSRASTLDILFKDNAVQVPADKGVEELHRKLQMLAEGQTWVPGAEDVDKSERLRQKAEHAAEEVKQDLKEEIHYIEPSSQPQAS
eukprot:scaffold526_cov159-Amphora_coffeaeformis.AAC.2